MILAKDVYSIGVIDKSIDLFEGIYKVPSGIKYNSYVIKDEATVVFDTVDRAFREQWENNLSEVLGGGTVDYLVVSHMEPDHSANIAHFMKKYPSAKIVASKKAFDMMEGFFGESYPERRIEVKDGDTLSIGKRTLTFYTAPMVHWPEVIVTYVNEDKILFSADAFGSFEGESEERIKDEMRRYFIGIVGKFGIPTKALLKKAAALDIKMICSLHGDPITDKIGEYVNLYSLWADYKPEEKGVTLAYTSVYGNTKEAALMLSDKLKEAGVRHSVFDLARCDMMEAVASAFRYSDLVLATTTYNGDVFPPMRDFIERLLERGFCSRRVGIIENGTWSPTAAKVIKSRLEGAKDVTYTDTTVTVKSALSDASRDAIAALAAELARE